MRYQNPSIVEALCEFQFAESSPWDPTAFGMFFKQIESTLPVREQGEAIAAAIGESPSGLEHRITRVPRMRFLSEERNRIVQLGEHLLVVNVLKPYPHWAGLLELVQLAGEVYAKEVAEAPVVKATVRYIDRLDFQLQGFRLSDWIKCDGEYFPKQLAECDSHAAFRLAMPVGDQEHFMLSLALNVEENGAVALTLDTEMFCERQFASVSETTDLLNSFHDKIVFAFESCITEKTRELLVPEGRTTA
jgi:uncharacterized protein (TIGR04255 family)